MDSLENCFSVKWFIEIIMNQFSENLLLLAGITNRISMKKHTSPEAQEEIKYPQKGCSAWIYAPELGGIPRKWFVDR